MPQRALYGAASVLRRAGNAREGGAGMALFSGALGLHDTPGAVAGRSALEAGSSFSRGVGATACAVRCCTSPPGRDSG